MTVGVEPDVEWRRVQASDGFLRFTAPTERRRIPDELFLRDLLEIDPDDDGQVVAFLNEHGMIGREYFDPAITPRAAQKALRRPIPDTARGVGNRVEDARWYLKGARALTRHWIAALEGADPAPAWADEGFRVIDADMAWGVFVEHFNFGLAAFAPHAEMASTRIKGVVIGRPHAGLYSGLCLQLANHLAEAAVVRHCAYCGRPFVRQLGGAALGQYRTEGVMYCTVRCARNQAQREYRRRKKEGSK
ncbi:MAG: hypothetical protein AB1679_10790 [Actinomycetota bacterium]